MTRRVQVQRVGVAGCPLHGADGDCPDGCRLADAIAPAPAPPGYVLHEGAWTPERQENLVGPHEGKP